MRTTSILMLSILVAGCGSKATTEDKPREDLNAEPLGELVFGVSQEIEGDVVPTTRFEKPYSHAFQAVYMVNIATKADLAITEKMGSDFCMAIDQEPGRIEGPYLALSTTDTKEVIATTRPGTEQIVPSYEFPGVVNPGTYLLEVLWLATSSGCGVNSTIELTEDDDDTGGAPPVSLILGEKLSFKEPLVAGGSPDSWSAYSLGQDFRLALTEPTNVTLSLSSLQSDCSEFAAIYYSIYDFQSQTSLGGEDLNADVTKEFGELAPGLYEFNVTAGDADPCALSFDLLVD